MIGVYAFIPKGKINPQYIGYSQNVEKRVHEHKRQGKPYALHDPWVLCQEFDNAGDAYLAEQSLIEKYKPIYNVRKKKKLERSHIFKCESIDEVLEGYERCPWKKINIAEMAEYNYKRNKWIEAGRPELTYKMTLQLYKENSNDK